eukprot:6445782-Prymnesium_polylepis.2
MRQLTGAAGLPPLMLSASLSSALTEAQVMAGALGTNTAAACADKPAAAIAKKRVYKRRPTKAAQQAAVEALGDAASALKMLASASAPASVSSLESEEDEGEECGEDDDDDDTSVGDADASETDGACDAADALREAVECADEAEAAMQPTDALLALATAGVARAASP